MNLLITGGAGYIGSHTIIEVLENTDWTPISVDNLSNSDLASYDRIHSITGKKIEHHEIDLLDKISLDELFQKHRFSGVMHFAAHKAVGESVQNPIKYYKNNIGGMLNLIELQKKHGVKHHIYSSSCTVYGTSTELPVTEKTPLAIPESPYGQTKLMGEQILNDVSNSDDIQVMALRYFNPVGAHSSGLIGELPRGVPNNLVPLITQTAAGLRDELVIFGKDYDTRDGTNIRDYVHVSDIARAHVLAMAHLIKNKQVNSFEYVNLGTGNGVTVKEALDAFIKVNKVDVAHQYGDRRPGDVEAIYADNSKAFSLLGWKAEHDLESMMTSAWNWQKTLLGQSL